MEDHLNALWLTILILALFGGFFALAVLTNGITLLIIPFGLLYWAALDMVRG